jgi:hypothetical protein
MSGSNEIPIARAIRGPITLITIGLLFALNNFTRYHFDQTWPVLLIVFGLLSLLRRSSEPPRPVAPPPPPYNPPGSKTDPSWTGGYRQSTYQDPGAGPAKGGFGSSAPPRTVEVPRAGDTPQTAGPSGDTQ